MAPRQWIFLDLGGTLIDESEAHRARFVQTVALLARHGVRSSVEQLWALTEEAATAFAPSPYVWALAQLGIDGQVAKDIRRTAGFDHAHERLYPGVAALLTRLGETFELGVIANQSLGTEQRLREHGIREHFTVIAASAELGFSKPDPRIFAHAAQHAGCAPSALMMVGDRLEYDILPAKRLGWRTVRVRQGFSSAQTPRGVEDTPDATIASIAELTSVL